MSIQQTILQYLDELILFLKHVYKQLKACWEKQFSI